MKLSMAALCDRATVREGLLHVLGAGVTICAMRLPSAPDVDLAVLLSASDYEELAGSHKITVSVVELETDETIGQIEAGWFGPPVPQEAEMPYPTLPVSVPLRALPVRSYGPHRVLIRVDGVLLDTLEFLVRDPDSVLPGVTSQPR